MNRSPKDDSGMTLIELILAQALSVIIIGTMVASLQLVFKTSTGLSADAPTSGAQNSDLLIEQVKANVGIQEFSRLFTADVENTVRAQDIRTDSLGAVPCSVSADPSLSPGSDTALLRITYPVSGTATTFDYRYSRDALGHFGQVVRYSCPSGNAKVIAAGLSSAAIPAAAVKSSGIGIRTVALSLTTVTGRAYSFTATQRLDLDTEPAPPTGVHPPAPLPNTVIALQMVDENTNGRPDAVLVTLASGAASCLASTWTLSDIPAGGTQGATTAASSQIVRVAINEGATDYDTAVGDLELTFTPAAGCSVSAFQDQPADAAPPVLVAMSAGAQPSGGTVGKMESGDSFALRFSEPLVASTVPLLVRVTETGGKSNPAPPEQDRIGIIGTGIYADKDLTLEELNLGAADSYVTSHSKAASYAGQVTPAGLDFSRLTVTLTGACSGTGNACNAIAAGSGAFTFVPATTLLDTSDNAATTSATSPQPGAGWRMF